MTTGSILVRQVIEPEQFESIMTALSAGERDGPPEWTWRKVVLLLVSCLAVGLLAQWSPARPTILLNLVLWAVLGVGVKARMERHRSQYRVRLYAEEVVAWKGNVLAIDKAGVSCSREDGSFSSRHEWQAIVRCIELDSVLVLLTSPRQFIAVPLQTLSPEQRGAVIEWSSSVLRRRSSADESGAALA